ncbi:YaiI/YqxD family protein [Mycoplasmatota bacterium]|nr:YaiI/YqxD family protein [Mycoplasmatota bacterium]
MKILVDADSCPVKEIIIKVAKTYNIDVILFFDTSHIFNDTYAKVIMVDKGKDSVDYELIKYINKNDIVITQDYGVACMSLSKHAYAISPDGLIYTTHNIDTLLLRRYLSAKERKANKRVSGPKKRNRENDINFEKSLLSIINKRVK